MSGVAITMSASNAYSEWTVSVECSDHRHRNVDQVQQDFLALAVNLVVSTRREEIEPFGIDTIDEGLTRAGQNDHASFRVLVDLMEEFHELLMRVAIEDQRVTVRMQDHLKHALGRAGELGVREYIPVGIEAGHPLFSPSIA